MSQVFSQVWTETATSGFDNKMNVHNAHVPVQSFIEKKENIPVSQECAQIPIQCFPWWAQACRTDTLYLRCNRTPTRFEMRWRRATRLKIHRHVKKFRRLAKKSAKNGTLKGWYVCIWPRVQQSWWNPRRIWAYCMHILMEIALFPSPNVRWGAGLVSCMPAHHILLSRVDPEWIGNHRRS